MNAKGSTSVGVPLITAEKDARDNVDIVQSLFEQADEDLQMRKFTVG